MKSRASQYTHITVDWSLPLAIIPQGQYPRIPCMVRAIHLEHTQNTLTHVHFTARPRSSKYKYLLLLRDADLLRHVHEIWLKCAYVHTRPLIRYAYLYTYDCVRMRQRHTNVHVRTVATGSRFVLVYSIFLWHICNRPISRNSLHIILGTIRQSTPLTTSWSWEQPWYLSMRSEQVRAKIISLSFPLGSSNIIYFNITLKQYSCDISFSF